VNKLSALALALGLVVAQVLLTSPGTAAASSAAEPDRLRLDISSMAPRLVTPHDHTLTISGTVTNVGDRRISDIVARLQVGQRQATEGDLKDTLAEPPRTDSGTSEWTTVSETLNPGESTAFTIKVPIADLGVSGAPGVYPLLVNVNGTPAYGGPARLAAGNLLLPVIDPPAETPPATVSMLWPIAASQPKVVAAPHDGPAVLADDRLARALAPGGRLDTLISTPASYRDNPKVFGSLCFAVDPDLLSTVERMSRGYRVRTPSGEVVPGHGRADAARWLETLRKLVAGHCVVQIPYADADLAALSEVSSPTDLVGDAVNNGAAVLNLLRLQPRAGVLWPTGSLNDAALRAAAGAGTDTLIVDPAMLGTTEGSGLTAVAGTDIRALPYDPLVASALRGDGSEPGTTGVATQNGLAALAFRAGLGDESPDRPVLVAPPHDWSAPAAELDALLAALAKLNSVHMVRPVPLDDLLTGPVTATAALGGVDTAAGTHPPEGVTESLSEVESTAADLQSAMSVDPTRQVQPIRLIQPLHNAVVRAISADWHGPAEHATAAAAAQDQLEALRRRVTVNTPSQPVSLASGSSPLPVTLSNGLPVAITVRIKLDNTAGLRHDRIPDTPLAANSRVSRLIPTEALRSGQFNVDVSLTTPGGTSLGAPARLEATSSEFGVVTVVITATGACALVLLSGLRFYRIVKSRRHPSES
jgi:hypothetical protein